MFRVYSPKDLGLTQRRNLRKVTEREGQSTEIFLKRVFSKPLGRYSQLFIFVVTYDWGQYAGVFVPGNPFQSSLMFGNKAGAPYHSLVELKGASLG
jgi:hypothetical protein